MHSFDVCMTRSLNKLSLHLHIKYLSIRKILYSDVKLGVWLVIKIRENNRFRTHLIHQLPVVERCLYDVKLQRDEVRIWQ